MKTCSPRSSKSLAYGLTIMAALCTAFTANSVSAQYYGGLSLGPLILDGAGPSGHDLTGAALEPGFSTPLVALRNSRTVYGLRFVYPLAANLAIEGGYSELARANYGATPLPGSHARNPDARSYGFDLAGAAPLFDRLSMFGRVGIQSIRTDIPSGGAGNPDLVAPSLAQTATAARFGVGVRYDFSNSLGLRLEVERFRNLGGNSLGEFSADNYSFGVRLKF